MINLNKTKELLRRRNQMHEDFIRIEAIRNESTRYYETIRKIEQFR